MKKKAEFHSALLVDRMVHVIFRQLLSVWICGVVDCSSGHLDCIFQVDNRPDVPIGHLGMIRGSAGAAALATQVDIVRLKDSAGFSPT